MITLNGLLLVGEICEECNCTIDGEAPGYARICGECFKDLNEDIISSFHQLKCHPEFFEEVRTGVKTFEIRFNDRGFKIGEGIRLREFNPTVKKYTGRDLFVEITYITDFEQKPGFVVLGIKSLCGMKD